MKDSLAALAGTLLIAHCTVALAASSVDLSVKGSITPSACTPSLSDGGKVEYGKISAKDLLVDDYTYLTPATLTLRVNCDADTLFALNAKDNRRGSAPHPQEYGLGWIDGDKKLGGYTLRLSNPVADTPVYTLFSPDYGKTWVVNPSGTWMAHDWLSAFGDTATPKALSNVTADLTISTSIVPSRNLPLTKDMRLDGSATLTVHYL